MFSQKWWRGVPRICFLTINVLFIKKWIHNMLQHRIITTLIDWSVLCPTWHKIGHFGDVPQLNLTQQKHTFTNQKKCTTNTTRMWANAQRDGCPAEYRWRSLFNATKFGWHPLLECCAVTLPRRKTHWNLQGCPKLANGSQPLVGRSSPHYQDMWRRYCCLTSFFSDCQQVP